MKLEVKFEVQIIPHAEQRYETCGDWWRDDNGVWQIRVSDLGNADMANLIAIHEINEILIALAMMAEGADPQDLVEITDKFDQAYEILRPATDTTSEPGYEPTCPVHRPHMIASAIEHLVAPELGVNYNEFGRRVGALDKNKVQ